MKKLYCAIIAALILALVLLMPVFSRDIREGSAASIRETVLRAAAQCYAVEGAYPPSLSYLEENYGLTYDKDKFFIDYRPIAANILPDVTIIRLQTEKEKVNKYEITE